MLKARGLLAPSFYVFYEGFRARYLCLEIVGMSLGCSLLFAFKPKKISYKQYKMRQNIKLGVILTESRGVSRLGFLLRFCRGIVLCSLGSYSFIQVGQAQDQGVAKSENYQG